jgi:precorrin-6A/cobalt-precorrin-6A reductase
MILVLAGTKDGRELAALVAQHGYQVMVSVFSDYGKELVDGNRVAVQTGPLDANGLTALIQKSGITIVVDASHPYAVNVSQNAMKACQTAGISYLRYERPTAILPAYERLYVVHDYAEAAHMAASLGNIIFLTTGSRHLKIFREIMCSEKYRLIARVLPEASVVTECLQLGFAPKDIVGLQGPFSRELNMALFKEYHAEVVVTKNSGKIGGSDTKITAAIDLHLSLVVIDRPVIQYSRVVYSADDLINCIKEEVHTCNI